MLPIMSYNPWTDIAENNRALELLREAHCQKFVGAKIYPPNGYLPYGNAAGSTLPGRPTGAQLDKVLEVFWLECQAMNFTVMSHSGPSMGGDDAQDVLSAPDQWRKLLRAGFWPDARGPKLNLGHFGGSRDHKRSHDGMDWPRQFATLMTEPRGENAYADLGYWEDLQCTREDGDCKKARQRLKDALAVTVNGVAPAADRVMFGSDWLMLSKEKNWSAYSRQLFKNIQGIAPTTVSRIFETNAKKCFAPWV
jgi:predicted TIM-barrel fold metal-dependent hydrolase